MLKFRTSKKVKTSVHDETESILEFHYHYHRKDNIVLVRVDCYKILEDDSRELVPAGCKTERIEDERVALTEPTDVLIADGIKQAIVNGYWKNQFTLADFE